MPVGGWVVESIIRFSTNGITTMERLSAATNTTRIREAELRGEITAQEAAWLRLDERVAKTRATRAAFLSEASGVGAIAGAAVLGFSLDQAANMERSMLNLQIATHSSRREMDAFKESVYQTAFATAQSAPDIAAIYGAIASTSGLPAKSLTPAFLSTVTKFGEIVQLKSKGTSHEYSALEASRQLIELAHQYRAYSPQQIGQFAEMLHKAIYFMPGGLSQFVTQSKYYAPLMAMSAGNVDAMQQSIDLGILLQQTGLGRGKGGTGVAAFEREILQGLSMTKFSQAGRHSALVTAGLIDKSGHTPFLRTNAQNQSYFDIIGALAQVQKYADAKTGNLTGTARSHAEETIIRTVLSALGINGSLVAMVAAGGGNLQMRNVREREKLIPSISQDQARRLQTFWGALQRDERGIQSLGAALGGPALKEITPLLGKFADKLRDATINLERNPGKASAVFNTIAVVTGILAIGAAARIVKGTLTFVKDGLVDIWNVGKKTVDITGKVASKLEAASSGLWRFAGAIGGVLEKLNIFASIEQLFDNASAQGPKNGYLPDWQRNMSPAQRAGQSGYMTRGAAAMVREGRNVHGPHVTIHTLHLSVTPAQGQSTHDAVNDLLTNPRSLLYQSASRRTNARLPAPTSVPPK